MAFSAMTSRFSEKRFCSNRLCTVNCNTDFGTRAMKLATSLTRRRWRANRLAALLAALAASGHLSGALAQTAALPQTATHSIALSTGLDSSQVTNATLAPERPSPSRLDPLTGLPLRALDERQDRVYLNLQTTFKEPSAFLISDYRLESRRYSEQPEQNTSLLLGQSQLDWGRDSSPLRLAVLHRADDILLDQRLGDTPGNRDHRDLTEARLYAQTRLGETRFGLYHFHQWARYEAGRHNDADSQGQGLLIARNLSPIYQAHLDIRREKRDYQNTGADSVAATGTLAANESQHLTLGLDTRLRRLHYGFEAGFSEYDTQRFNRLPDPTADTTLIDDQSQGGQYRLFVLWRDGAIQTQLAAAKRYEDASFGAGAAGRHLTEGAQPSPTQHQAPAVGFIQPDQYQLDELQWTLDTQNLCGRCRSHLGLLWSRQVFDRLSDQNQSSRSAEIRQEYRIRPRQALGIALGYRQLTSPLTPEPITENRWAAEYRLERLARRWTLRAYAESINRHEWLDAVPLDLTQHRVGLQVDWLIYERRR